MSYNGEMNTRNNTTGSGSKDNEGGGSEGAAGSGNVTSA